MLTFGRDTILKFSKNVSDLSRLAARDFEDILQARTSIFMYCMFQCAIPIFEGLLPEPYNTIVLNLLFELATWHAFRKLHIMHTETTRFHFDNSTTRLGIAMWKFSQECCMAFKTYDLPHETAAWACCQGSKVVSIPQKQTSSNPRPSDGSAGRKPHSFNMATYKMHALGDYVMLIQLFGMTDNLSKSDNTPGSFLGRSWSGLGVSGGV
ncbi:hypothetical protein BKA82DRAFT_127596 [Pisolithus tinctorius]|uniref:Uncharacterized protein n=1 Tax=Pisolithus tinctorius Marx 270 TaxID=870435 RepID=A0A0C3JPM4_PISTI|nr:hypothetical protein BKA82DRAFT_127596 [Pisolithus tinctorius]KIO11153.1 hypothetical protein M404DRAFT_127596 [Pisolithus tinctorius Marx 270]